MSRAAIASCVFGVLAPLLFLAGYLIGSHQAPPPAPVELVSLTFSVPDAQHPGRTLEMSIRVDMNKDAAELYKQQMLWVVELLRQSNSNP